MTHGIPMWLGVMIGFTMFRLMKGGRRHRHGWHRDDRWRRRENRTPRIRTGKPGRLSMSQPLGGELSNPDSTGALSRPD